MKTGSIFHHNKVALAVDICDKLARFHERLCVVPIHRRERNAEIVVSGSGLRIQLDRGPEFGGRLLELIGLQELAAEIVVGGGVSRISNAMADTVKSIVRTSSAQLSLDGLLRASEQTLLEGFEAQHLWIKTVADEGHSGAEYLPDEVSDWEPRTWSIATIRSGCRIE